jgi:site-specific recombinase XerD
VKDQKKSGATSRNSEIVPTNKRALALPVDRMPAEIIQAGNLAQFAYQEFILGSISNPKTRIRYERAIRQFFAWCQERSLSLRQITPGDVGQYFSEHPGSAGSKNVALAAIRHLFDVLVMRHAVILNPAKSVRGERNSVIEGKTPEMRPEQTRALLVSIDTSTIVGLRDYTIIATLAYTAARVGAIAKLTRGSVRDDGGEWSLTLKEKGGKHRVIPVRSDLKDCLGSYLSAAGLWDAPKPSPLFRGTVRREKRLTDKGLSGLAICRMFKRRLKGAGLPQHLSPHSVRGGSATDLLMQGVPLEDVQYLLGHADPRTTRFYDHRAKRVTRNIVERISSVTLAGPTSV